MKRITITFEDDAYKFLKDSAKNNRRHMSSELNTILIYLKNQLANDPNSLISPSLPSSSSPSLSLSSIPTTINDRPIKKIEFATPAKSAGRPAHEMTPEEQEIHKMKLQQQKDALRQKRVDYFKKKYFEIYGETPPAAFRRSAIDYILLTHPDNASLDEYINNDLSEIPYSQLEDPYHEFYVYEEEINEREEKLIIPFEQNYIYKTIKNYCLMNNKSITLYDMIQYSAPPFSELIYFSKATPDSSKDTSFLYELFNELDLTDEAVQQQFVDAFTWDDSDE